MSDYVPPRHYTAREVAAMYQVSVRTVQRWMSEGLIGFRRIGAYPRFDPEHLRAFDERTNVPAKEIA